MSLGVIVKTTLLLLSVSRPAHGLYGKDDSSLVKTFNSTKEFRHNVLDSPGVSLVQFYAPWCQHCEKFAPYFEKVAVMLEGKANVVAVDAVTEGPMKRVANDNGVDSYPSMKIFRSDGAGGNSVEDLEERDPNKIVKAVLEAAKKKIKGKTKGKSKSSGANTVHEEPTVTYGDASDEDEPSHEPYSNDFVTKLDKENFNEVVFNTDSVVLVAFVAEWCGHCKMLMPEWGAAAEALDSEDVVLAMVDGTMNSELLSDYDVTSFPTIKVFPGGSKKTKNDASDYKGGRLKDHIVSGALDEIARSGTLKEIPELTNQQMFEHTCNGGEGKNTICVFFALPHILDTGAEGRNKYRDVMTMASKVVRGMSFKLFWFEGGNQQQKLENALDLTFGFPAVAAYSMEKQIYVVHRNSFSEANLRKFFMKIMAGKATTDPLKEKLVVVETEPWDGKDGVPFEEEPLEDFWDDDDEGAGNAGEL